VEHCTACNLAAREDLAVYKNLFGRDRRAQSAQADPDAVLLLQQAEGATLNANREGVQCAH
jgi:hypothetical protein